MAQKKRSKPVRMNPKSDDSVVPDNHLNNFQTNPVQEDVVKAVPSVPAETDSDATALVVVNKELSATLSKPANPKELEKYLGLDLSQYELHMDQATMTRYKRHIMSLKHGMHAGIPLACYGGRKCPIGSRCPFTEKKVGGVPDYDSSTYPLLQPCPIEGQMAHMHMMDMVEEYQIGPEDYTDLAIVSKLSTLNVLEYRCNMALATDAEGLVISEVSSVDYQSGKEFITRKINPAFEVLEKIQRMRQELIRSMIGTRREKYKAAVATGDNVQKSSLTKNMNDLLQMLKAGDEQDETIEDVVDIDSGIIDVEFEESRSDTEETNA